MNPFKKLVIVVSFFIFFISCGDKAQKNNKKEYDKKKSNENLFRVKEKNQKTEKNKLKDRFKELSVDNNKERLVQRKLKIKRLVQSKGLLGGGASFNGSSGNEFVGGRGSRGTGMGSGSSSVNTYSNTEKYTKIKDNKLKETQKEPLSTFSIDVDTASYSLVKSMIKNNNFNSKAVRIEEFINYFSYDYPQPKDKDIPFSVTTEVGPSILNKNRSIIHIGIQGRKKADEKRKHANLVFLVDTSGSMSSFNKLPLLKKSLNILINNLTKNDVITIVTYAGDSYVALEPTNGANKNKIKEAIDKLKVYGGTNGEGGIKVAYKEAMKKFDVNKINRILLCTDGDFNIGVSSVDELKELVKEKRKTGVSLSTIGFGRGNYNDAIMEKLADNGNGNYFYINDLKEATKVFSKELTANLEIIAKDVKIQVEFNKKYISFYRLIGYENKILKKEDFNNDKVDAGEIGSGHSVTALYEVVFTNNKIQPIDKLRYPNTTVGGGSRPHTKITLPYTNPEIAFVKLRYKKTNTNKSILIKQPILEKNIIKDLKNTSNNFRFSSSVAAFALKLKNSDNISISNKKLLEIAKSSKGSDEFGYRKEFISFINRLDSIKTNSNSNNNNGTSIGVIGETFDKTFLSSGTSSRYNPYRRPLVNISDKIIKVSGGLIKLQIKKVVRRKFAQIRYCYERELIRNPNLKGSIILNWVINPQGSVVMVKVRKASLENKTVQKCIQYKIKRFRFPESKENTHTKVTYMFKFKAIKK